MKKYTDELIRRGRLSAGWVADQVDNEGCLPCEGDLGCYYKCVYPLRSAGHNDKAALLLETILRIHLTPGGDLRNSENEKTKGTYTSHYSQVYPNGWIVLGAWLLGRFDAVRMLMKGVTDNYYDTDMCTFRACSKPPSDIFDVNSAAMAVELFLLTDIGKAEKAAGFLIDHINRQPDIQNRYYSKVIKPFDFVTEPDGVSDTYSFVKIGEKDQAFWFFGMPCAALTQLYEFTGKKVYLETAEKYFSVFLSCGENAFRGAGSGKAFWSSSMLYRITGRQVYLDSCLKLMDFFFSIQREDGTFLMPGMKAESLTPKFLFDTTPEYARWFLEVASELGAI